MTQYNPGVQGEISTERLEDLGEPPMFRVLLHNDDYTTMEFVVDILMGVFNKSHEEAVAIMLKVHQEGVGICGI
jgi:ATP-dependent Clp protease adaptor protein ClpS